MQTIISSGLFRPFGITVDESRVYWTDWETESIGSADKESGDEWENVQQNLEFVTDLRMFKTAEVPGKMFIIACSCFFPSLMSLFVTLFLDS